MTSRGTHHDSMRGVGSTVTIIASVDKGIHNKTTKPAKATPEAKTPVQAETPAAPAEAPRPGKEEQIVYIKLSELHAFKNHPFQVRNDEEMKAMVSSVRDKGVTQPAIVRPREDGGYEIVSGHRRQKASELAGFVDMPCIVRDLTDEQAITQMVEDNTNQRENILPSERAKALKMQLEAIKHQGAKEVTSGQLDPKDAGRRSNEIVSQLLRNPVYAQADLEMYEFFKSQGTVVVNDAADFAGTNGCYLYQGRDVKEDKDKSLKDQILVIAPHEGFVSADVWLRCRKKLMTNTTFQNGRKARNTWLAGKIKCGKCGYALKTTHNPSGYEYLRCSKRADHKGCPGCGTLRKTGFEQFIFTVMGEKFREFKLLRGGEEKANPKITAYQVELAQVEAEIEKLLDTLTGANATLLAYANKKIEDLDNRRKTLSKAIADLSVETLSSQQIELLSGYLDDWENISFEDKRKAADGLISSISATSDYVKIEWKI